MKNFLEEIYFLKGSNLCRISVHELSKITCNLSKKWIEINTSSMQFFQVLKILDEYLLNSVNQFFQILEIRFNLFIEEKFSVICSIHLPIKKSDFFSQFVHFLFSYSCTILFNHLYIQIHSLSPIASINKLKNFC